ncbi:MAG: LacI family DNA-binding transcriptional regulator [Ignavibacteriae bacterium]|nr:LacI family DNA-binding transcriptional regulator [Ignavibacteriota bacterium]
MTSKSIRLSDIAEKLNVSTVTVSKALRDHPDISPQTKKLIIKAASEMGYTPNFMARNLSSRKSNTIGVVVPKIAHFFFGSIIESIYDIAFTNNYEIILTVSQEDEEREKRHIQTLLSMRVDGIIISISQDTKDYSVFETVKSRGVPIVFMDRIPQISNIDTVFVDDRGGAFKAVEHAIKLGYKKIAHFAGYSEINIGKQRYLGFEDAMKKYNLPINPNWICHGGFGEKYGYDAFMRLYKENNLPDLIFTVTYPVALGIYMAASEVNMKIPDEIDVICFGDAKIQKFLSPPLSCITQPTNLIAEKSMEILFNRINYPEEKPSQNIEIPTELVIRGTCKKFNKQ